MRVAYVKKVNGITYCSNCRARVHEWDTVCNFCGAFFNDIVIRTAEKVMEKVEDEIQDTNTDIVDYHNVLDPYPNYERFSL